MTIQSTITSPIPVKLTVDDFLLLDKSGAFDAYRKTELIDGMIVAMSAQFRPHLYAKGELAYRMRRTLEVSGSTLYVGQEASVDMRPVSMPEPDIVLTSEPRGAGPIPLASVALLVEISDSTLAFDLGDKLRAYAANNVPEYWVVDLEGRTIHQMWSPQGDGFRERRAVALGERIEAATVPGLAVETGDV